MIKLKYLFLFFVSTTSIISCVPTKSNQQIDHSEPEVNENNVISDPTNYLTGNVETLQVDYTVWGCACPTWIRSKDNENNDTTKNYLKQHFYLEPENKSLELPIYFDASRHQLEITGQYYKREDYPQGTIEMEEPMPKAKVFRYSSIKVIDKPNFKPDSKTETITLIYNALSCTCAQWGVESGDSVDHVMGINYWLEPSSENLIKSDKLFTGQNLPLKIKVTGQVVSENGFPKRENISKVERDEAGIVFRYSKIEVIQNGSK